MKFQINQSPWLLCSTEKDLPERYACLAHVYFDADKWELCASNRYAAVYIPVEASPGDVSGFIPVAAFLAAIRQARVESKAKSRANVREGIRFAFIDCSDAAKVRVNEVYWDRIQSKPFHLGLEREPPAWRYKPVTKFAINPSLLCKVSDALGSKSVELRFENEERAARVIPGDHQPGWGLIMPYTLGT